MSIFARFRAIDDKDKAAAVRRLLESSTPKFDFFYITVLAVLMATFGVLADSVSIVIGSMLIAPVLYPILAVGLGLVMSSPQVITRASFTLLKAFGLSVVVSAGAATMALLFSDVAVVETFEVMSRTEPSLLHFLVAVVAGAAVAYVIGQPEWSDTLPGIAISVALIPPLAVVGVGFAAWDADIITGAFGLLALNVLGIVSAAVVTFSLMNLYEKEHIASSTIKKEDEKLAEEQATIQQMDEQLKHN